MLQTPWLYLTNTAKAPHDGIMLWPRAIIHPSQISLHHVGKEPQSVLYCPTKCALLSSGQIKHTLVFYGK